MYKISILLSFLSFIPVFLNAQSIGSSPYSRIGIGDLSDRTLSRQGGMGGAGVALSNPLQANSLNPASLPSNKLTNMEFDLAAKFNNQNTNSDFQRTASVGFYHIQVAFPIAKRFTSAVGLRPYSTVNHESVNYSTFQGKSYETINKGNGGVTEFFLANGFSINQNWSVGLQLSYLTGSITSEQLSRTATDNYYKEIQRRFSQTNIGITPGITYTREISVCDYSVPNPNYLSHLPDSISQRADSLLIKKKYFCNSPDKKGSGIFWSIGGTFSFYQNTKAREVITFIGANTITRSVVDDPLTGRARFDTLSYTNFSSYSLPIEYRLGIGLSKPNSWSFAADYHTGLWSSYKGINEIATFRNYTILALGAEWIPTYLSSKYYKRIAYRAGIHAANLPYVVQNKGIQEVAINVGASFPIAKTGVIVNTTLSYGRRGTTDNGLIREDFIRFNIGVISNSRWFLRRKVD